MHGWFSLGPKFEVERIFEFVYFKEKYNKVRRRLFGEKHNILGKCFLKKNYNNFYYLPQS